MATATKADPYRVELQEELRGVDDLRQQYRQAMAKVEEAERLVFAGDKHPNYVERRKEEAQAVALRLNHIRNHHAPFLRSACTDQELNNATVILRKRKNDAERSLRDAERDHDEALRLWKLEVENLEGRFGDEGEKWAKVDPHDDGTFDIAFHGSETALGRENQVGIRAAGNRLKMAIALLEDAQRVHAEALAAYEENREARVWSPV